MKNNKKTLTKKIKNLAQKQKKQIITNKNLCIKLAMLINLILKSGHLDQKKADIFYYQG